MRNEFQNYDFPKQRIPTSEKDDAWGAKCCDWVIAQGVGQKDEDELEMMYGIIQGVIPDEAYKKILNPYNSTNEKYTRFPATMRHYDMLKGIIRRYVSEYLKNPHDFIVGANNPEVVLAKNAKLQEELAAIVEQQIAAKLQEAYAQWVNEGQDPQQFNPSKSIDIPKFIEDFNEKYIDDISAQGQQILNVIRDITEDSLLYVKVYFDFVCFGECFTYSDIRGKELIKESVSARDAYPVRENNFFVEDDGAFARRRRLTYQQIMDEFDDDFSDKDREFMEKYYARQSTGGPTSFAFSTYQDYFPEVCGKFTDKDREIFKSQKVMSRDSNGDLYDVWHVVWRGEIRQAIVTFINQASLIDTRIEPDDYKFNPDNGDISIEYAYQPQVYESTRIGTRNDSIYPYSARAIAFNRNGKLPYNGVTELLPGFGKFSIVKTVTPYSVFYNIVAYNREMAIARNKLSILMMAKSLLGKVPEKVIHKMIADGVLYYDDTDDQVSLKAQQVRMLQASNSQYITELTALMKEVEQAAKDQVDMTPQRYGEIANSAGKGTTSEAITRGSMGSVIIEFIVDMMRERDYARDMDYSKLAWIDGLDTSYRDSSSDDNLKYISLDVDKHHYADYLLKAKNSVKEKEKLDQYKQLAFSAAQNGDMGMAVAAINGDNIATISKFIDKYQKDKEAYELNIKQLEQQTEQMREEFETTKIRVKGEEDRKLEELKGTIEAEIQLIKADANMISFDNGVGEAEKQAGMQRLEQTRSAVAREKIEQDRQKTVIDAFNKFEDRKLKDKDIDTKLKIANANKNRFDKK